MTENPSPIPDPFARVVAVYDSWDGHTEKIAGIVAEGVCSVAGVSATLHRADAVTREDLRGCDALIMGSPVHQRTMAWPMKRFVDLVCEPAWFYDDLVGRAGAVFTTGGGHGDAGGGCELAQLSMLGNLAACGMTLVTFPKTTPGFQTHGMHWGPHFRITGPDMVARSPEEVAEAGRAAAFHHGANVARVALRLKGITMANGNGWPTPEVIAQRRAREAAAPLPIGQRSGS